jgi:hypothetical protein
VISWYDWPGGREAMLRFGPAEGPVVVAALPLFEEANRTRTFVVTLLRLLAERGIASTLPDLPGTGESLVPVAQMRLADLRSAWASAAGAGAYSVAIRSGTLLDTSEKLAGRWHLARQSGPDLARELTRIRAAGGGTDFGGNAIPEVFLAELANAMPAEAEIASRAVAPLWRRAEPDNDPALAAALADDIAAWVHKCED